ncbi:MAG: response regulator [Sphingomonadales bacterium]|jgi:CheY-like chemotaxis protein/DNA-directed RNA polymerase specialized sigma24 family protein
MMHVAVSPGLSRAALAPHLPGLRRYARALSGSQPAGDAHVAAALAALVAGRARYAGIASPRLALFLAFQQAWSAAPAAAHDPDRESAAETGLARAAGQRLAAITPLSRQALLLAVMEDFAIDEIALLLAQDEAGVAALIAAAKADIARQTRSRVLIIEDEPMIALEIEAIVADMGHEVIGIAATRRAAAALAAQERPGLLLADIHLDDGSSGVEAVRDIRRDAPAPAIFITGHPDRLSTGEGPEPAFLIAKPFAAGRVHAAIAQALFFGPAEAADG